jgi:hypothetical protein
MRHCGADLISKGFEVSKSCPFVFKMKGKKLYLLIYVDDILVIGPDEKEIAQAKKILSELYEVNDIGVAKYFLVVEIHQGDDGSMSLSQRRTSTNCVIGTRWETQSL